MNDRRDRRNAKLPRPDKWLPQGAIFTLRGVPCIGCRAAEEARAGATIENYFFCSRPGPMSKIKLLGSL